VGGGPDLIADDGHHEDEVEAKGPQNGEFEAFEMAAGDGMLLGAGELFGFERGENPALIVAGSILIGKQAVCFCHDALTLDELSICESAFDFTFSGGIGERLSPRRRAQSTRKILGETARIGGAQMRRWMTSKRV
jgi:hypothetical protein